jgi:hypothetical protein
MLDLVPVLQEIDRRGEQWRPGTGIVTVLREAGATESDWRKLVRALKFIHDRTRNYVCAIGDDRRERGVAAPLGGFPAETKSPAVQPHEPAGDSSHSMESRNNARNETR